MSELELLLDCQLAPVRPFVREYTFCEGRRWRFDFAWPELLVAVEIQGGIWTRGRHVRGHGFENDCAKRNAANRAGWCLLEYTAKWVRSGWACAEIIDTINRRRQGHASADR